MMDDPASSDNPSILTEFDLERDFKKQINLLVFLVLSLEIQSSSSS